MNEDKILCSCENIRFSYGNKNILKDCSIEIRKGELIGLIGENGSGKSTLLRCILSLEKIKSGNIFISGKIGYCPQENYLYKRYTLMEHINLIGTILKNKASDDFVNELLEKFKLNKYKNTLIEHLSSGTYQKLKFITSLISKPDIIILDEPYDGFDWEMYQMFWSVIEKLKTEGAGILLVSHFIHDFEKFDRIYQLQEGITYSEK
ncbi:MAG TPA: ABC transporter ATP-binding protein [Spirochaetota bacterium]|nr:ABC transporter ATP-binding protein [Spirochaetota bacterium]